MQDFLHCFKSIYLLEENLKPKESATKKWELLKNFILKDCVSFSS